MSDLIPHNNVGSVKCQLSDYVFLRCVPRRTIIAKTSNLHQKVGYRQDYKYRKLHAYTPKTLTVVLSLVQTRKNPLSATCTYYRKSIHRIKDRIVSILGSTSKNGHKRAVRVSKNSTKIISSCMFIAFVDLLSLRVQFRVVFGTRIFELLEEDPTYIQKQNRTKKGDYNRYLQPKE